MLKELVNLQTLIGYVHNSRLEVDLEESVINAAAMRYLKQLLIKVGFVTLSPVAIQYCRASAVTKSTEQIEVFYLDGSKHYIADEIISFGTVDHVVMQYRTLFKSAFAVNAKHIFLYRNDLSPVTNCDTRDLEMHRQLKKCCELLDFSLAGHIVAGPGWACDVTRESIFPQE